MNKLLLRSAKLSLFALLAACGTDVATRDRANEGGDEDSGTVSDTGSGAADTSGSGDTSISDTSGSGDTGTTDTGADGSGDTTPAGFCGDGLVGDGEACDDGAANSDTTPDGCRTDCTLAGCGDSVIDTGETCDDGNIAAGDGCDANCKVEVSLDRLWMPPAAVVSPVSHSTPSSARSTAPRMASAPQTTPA